MWKKFFKKFNSKKLIDNFNSTKEKIENGIITSSNDNGIKFNNYFKDEYVSKIKNNVTFHFLFEILINLLIDKQSYANDKNSVFITQHLRDLVL